MEIVIVVIFAIVSITIIVSCYKSCPPNKILVVYKAGETPIKHIHNSGAFVLPVVQNYGYLDLSPIAIEINLKNAHDKHYSSVDISLEFKIAISTEREIINNAAERLLGLTTDQIKSLAEDVLLAQLRLVIATLSTEEIDPNDEKFLDNVANNVDSQLNKLGLILTTINT